MNAFLDLNNEKEQRIYNRIKKFLLNDFAECDICNLADDNFYRRFRIKNQDLKKEDFPYGIKNCFYGVMQDLVDERLI